jgi:uncharacterized protein with ParB-like and HNH nuclease domain
MQIFEILNDRGLELTKIDRIRAAVVNAFFDAEDRQEYVDKWEDIVVAFATDEDKIDDYLSIYLSIVNPETRQSGKPVQKNHCGCASIPALRVGSNWIGTGTPH